MWGCDTNTTAYNTTRTQSLIPTSILDRVQTSSSKFATEVFKLRLTVRWANCGNLIRITSRLAWVLRGTCLAMGRQACAVVTALLTNEILATLHSTSSRILPVTQCFRSFR